MKCMNFSKIAMLSLFLSFGAIALFSCTTIEENPLVEATLVETDTIITFDPVTKKETIQIVNRVPGSNPVNTSENNSISGTTDTIIVFDPETLEEKIIVVKND